MLRDLGQKNASAELFIMTFPISLGLLHHFDNAVLDTALASGHNSENPAQALKHRTAVKSNKSFSFIKHYLTVVGQTQNFKNPISPSILF